MNVHLLACSPSPLLAHSSTHPRTHYLTHSFTLLLNFCYRENGLLRPERGIIWLILCHLSTYDLRTFEGFTHIRWARRNPGLRWRCLPKKVCTNCPVVDFLSIVVILEPKKENTSQTFCSDVDHALGTRLTNIHDPTAGTQLQPDPH